MRPSEIPQEELYRDSLGCPGCAAVLAVRLTLKALGRNTIFVVPANCISVVSCYYPQAPFEVPMFVMAFAATGAAISGIAAGLKRKGKSHINVVGFAGDGGTADIGIQSLSGMIDMGYKCMYVCYDNEAYMNTGVQRSGLTPRGAVTSTTPTFQRGPKKDMMRIVAAQDIPYAATACTSFPQDFIEKAQKASKVDGPTFLHVLSPCPPGWGFDPARTIEVGRLAVRSGLWDLVELERGQIRPTYAPGRRVPVADYFAAQSRFRNLSKEDTDAIQAEVDEKRGDRSPSG